MELLNGQAQFSAFRRYVYPSQPKQADLAQQIRSLRESIEMIDYNWLSVFADYLAEIRRDGFLPGIGTVSDRKDGANWPFYRTEIELNLLRSGSRILAGVNQHGGGMLGAISGYVIDVGMVPKCTPKDGTNDDRDAKLCKLTQAVIDDFVEENAFDEWQIQAFMDSQINDGCYTRIFDHGGYAELRNIQPECITQPPGSAFEEWSFGHRTRIDDPEKTLSYWVTNFGRDGEEVADIKADPEAHDAVLYIPNSLPGRWSRGIKRSIPLFAFGTRDVFDAAEKLARNMGLGNAVRQAYAFIRQWEFASEEDLKSFNTNRQDYGTPRPFQPTTTRPTERIEPGRVEDIPAGMKMAEPPWNRETQASIGVCDLLYRSAGQLWSAPEYVISGNAANMAAYTAALATASHFVKRIRQGQSVYRRRFLWILEAVRRFAVRAGRLPEEVMHRVKLDLTPPTVEVINKLEEAQRNQLLVSMGVKSRQLVAEEEGIDFQRVMDDNRAFAAETSGGAGGDDENEPTPGQPQQIPIPGAATGEPEEGDLDPFGDITESISELKESIAALGTNNDNSSLTIDALADKLALFVLADEPKPTLDIELAALRTEIATLREAKREDHTAILSTVMQEGLTKIVQQINVSTQATQAIAMLSESLKQNPAAFENAVVKFGEQIKEAVLRESPVVNVEAPIVHVAAPNVEVKPQINVEVPKQEAPTVNVEVKPEIKVDVPPANIELTVPPARKSVEFELDAHGRPVRARIKPER